MKKIVLPLIGVIAVTLIFYACKKDSIESITLSSKSGSEEISIREGRLAFSSIEAYEKFLAEGQNAKENLKSKLAFKSQKKNSSDTLIEDDFLAELLNEKNMIEIGGKVYKLDFSEEKVYVLSEVNERNMILLDNKNQASGKIKVYSMDEPVLLIEEGENEQTELSNSSSEERRRFFCRERGARRAKSDNKVNGQWPILQSHYYGGKPSNTASIGLFCMRAEAYNIYQSAGIYFSLLCRFKYFYDDNYPKSGCTQTGGYKNADTYFDFTIRAKYQPICRGEETRDYWDTPGIDEECDHKRNSRIYGSIRPLKKFSLSSEVTYIVQGCEKYIPDGTGKWIGTASPNCLIRGYDSCQ